MGLGLGLEPKSANDLSDSIKLVNIHPSLDSGIYPSDHWMRSRSPRNNSLQLTWCTWEEDVKSKTMCQKYKQTIKPLTMEPPFSTLQHCVIQAAPYTPGMFDSWKLNRCCLTAKWSIVWISAKLGAVLCGGLVPFFQGPLASTHSPMTSIGGWVDLWV